MKTLQRLSFLLCASLSISALVACDATIAGDGDEAGTSGGDSNGDGNDGGNWEPCSDANPCPDGQFCFNGLCAVGCTSDGDCADNQYCDTDSLLCQNNEVPTCQSDDDCASSQICVNGYCSTPPDDTSCNFEDPNNDGCPSNAVCLEDLDNEGVGVCYSMPACSADGTCPVGLYGAVCNDDYLPSKDKICLLGVCESGSDCPSDWNCVRLIQNSVLGNCSSGGFGEPCASNEDCNSGMCVPLPGLSGGFCQ